MNIDFSLRPESLLPKLRRFWELSGQKIRRIDETYDPAKGSPVFTVQGQYTARGWTEWTQGFQYGSAILQFDATGDAGFLEIGRRNTVERMAPHVSHVGVHDHGFNNVSTYGNLLRLMNEGRIADERLGTQFLRAGLEAQRRGPGAALDGHRRRRRLHLFVQRPALAVRRYDPLAAGAGRRASAGPRADGRERPPGLAARAAESARREHGQVVGLLRQGPRRLRPSRPRGARGDLQHQRRQLPLPQLAAGLLAVLHLDPRAGLGDVRLRRAVGVPRRPSATPKLRRVLLEAAQATCDFYIDQATAADGIPYWDTGAPNLHRLGDWQSRPADPFNAYEPVDSSAAAIAAQGLAAAWAATCTKQTSVATRQAGLTVLDTLLDEPYLSTDAEHQGLILHSVYHRPNGWDYVPPGQSVPCGESSMWGDYHAREAALYVQRIWPRTSRI